MVPRATQLKSADVHARIDGMLLAGDAQTMAEAENRFLDENLSQLVELVTSLTDQQFREHEAVKLLLAHGSRSWEDSAP